MNNIKDLFGDMALDKPIEVEIEGKTLKLDMRVEDLHSLMAMGQKEDVGEDDIEQLTDTLRNVLYRTYMPHYDSVRGQEPDELSKEKQRENEKAKEYIEGILLRHYLDLFVGISEELGWDEGGQSSDFPARGQL